MPVSVRRVPPGDDKPKPEPIPEIALRVPQARVLRALMPIQPGDPKYDWPTFPRPHLGVLAGYTAVSGTITRALNGIRPGSSSDKKPDGSPGDGHPGLLALKLIEELVFDIDGLAEINYRITEAGIAAYTAYIAKHGALPELRDVAASINHRYKKNPEIKEKGG